jgi:hypothetical protein
MNDALLEELLHEDESATLDFKRDQYPFAGGADEQKSELLKDILAFANAWRRTTAYILIGVDEVKGGRSLPIGVPLHLNDNELQQFVNSKTNRPVTFSYQAYSFQNTQLGIIEIPVQTRPTYLKKAFGKLHASTVYVRRGSSTDLAQPDELARMGAADAGPAEVQPSLELEWADLYHQSGLGASVEVQSCVLDPRLSPTALMPHSEILGFPSMGAFNTPGEEYYRDLITYVYESELIVPLGLCIRNTGNVAARNVLVTSRIEKVAGVRFHDSSEEPTKPSKHPYLPRLAGIRPLSEHLQQKPRPRVADFPTHWELTVPFGNVLPKATVWSTDVIYVGSESSIDLAVPIQVYAENLAHPVSLELTVAVSSERRPMTRADLDDDSDE